LEKIIYLFIYLFKKEGIGLYGCASEASIEACMVKGFSISLPSLYISKLYIFRMPEWSHSGEHFLLCFKGCLSRFTHANRHCPKHPYARLKREEPTDALSKHQSPDNKAAAEWLAK
jgi:hypothetical protein